MSTVRQLSYYLAHRGKVDRRSAEWKKYRQGMCFLELRLQKDGRFHMDYNTL